jgi:alpha-mannosidase
MADPDTPGAPPAYTLFLDQSAHLDWDWVRTFAQNFWYYKYGRGVNDIIAAGIEKAYQGNGGYYYTVCEMGFLRRFLETNPSQIEAIQGLGNNFQVISGGVTSPDCLVCSGEGFIRNYLVGQTWLKATLGIAPRPHCWLPDDFGQGPELPVLLAALGFVSVAFSRLPGTAPGCNRPGLQNQLVANGLDFIWPASDGSRVIAHWLINGYDFGNQLIDKYGKPDPAAIKQFVAAYNQQGETSPPYSAGRHAFHVHPDRQRFQHADRRAGVRHHDME